MIRHLTRVETRLCLVLVVFALLSATGCAARRPLEAWQKEVTRFVVVEGNGDPSCLRDTSDLRSRRGGRPVPLTVSSIDAPATRSRDARGVLVGQCQVNGRPWYVFLLAIVDFDRGQQSDIESVRPIALTADAEGVHWFTPRNGDEAPPAYLESSRRQKNVLATRYASFPGPRDVFDMDTRGGDVTITERTSGARWTLQLPTSLRRTKEADDPTTIAARATASR